MTTAAFRRFEMELRKEMRDVEKGIGQAARKLAIDAFASVIRKSPVDTGLFRSNWMVSFGEVGDETQQMIDSPGAVVYRGSAKIKTARTYTSINLYNALPYAQALEDGWSIEGGGSMQAPMGIVAVTIAEIETQFGRLE